MGWEKDYERWRDMGHTWGPGVDDRKPLSAAEKRSYDEYQQRLAACRVPPREKYLLAGKELKRTLPDHKAIIHGKAPQGWREAYSTSRLQLCKEAATSLGYSLVPMSETSKRENCFMIKVPHYATLPDRGGNIHPYVVSNIRDLHDCLQLVSDFSSIGQQVTTYFGLSFHYSCNDTGRLYLELESWSRSNGIPLPIREPLEEHPRLDDRLSETAAKTHKDTSACALQRHKHRNYQKPPECDR